MHENEHPTSRVEIITLTTVVVKTLEAFLQGKDIFALRAFHSR
jgi:hypothetical protein